MTSSTATTSKHPPPPSSTFLEEEESEQYLDDFHMFGTSPPPSPVHPYQNFPRDTLEEEKEEPGSPEGLSETSSVEETTFSSSSSADRRQRRRVRFNPIVDERDSSTTYTSLQDRKSRWYTRTELHAMKQAAVRLAKYSHREHMVHVISSARQQGQPQQQQQQQPMPRGLEGCTVERLKHKAMTIKCVVMTYKKMSRKYRENLTKKSGDGDDETDVYVSQLSMNLSKWNTDLAFLQGCLDYFESYRPELLPHVPTLQSVGPPPRIHLIPKRGITCTSTEEEQQQEQGRRVRQKRCYLVEGPPSA